MQPPTPTKNHRPGTKVRTFVQANGALLAEQEVVEYQQTPYEILRFVHQDASGSGVQQTLADGTLALPNGRTAEYDAMGRNVADPGPYVTLNTQPPSENGSGIDLFGNGEGYRPGRRTFTVNGWPIPESEFSDRFSMFAFNFVFAAARMSTYEVGRWFRTTTTPGIGTGVKILDEDDTGDWSPIQNPSVETRLLSIVYNTSWSFTTVIIPVPPQISQDDYRLSLGECTAMITGFLQEYARKDGRGSIDAFTHVERILRFASGEGGYNRFQTAFAIANAIQETNWFKDVTEPITVNCRRYIGGCDYRGRGYTHVTHQDKYEEFSRIYGQDFVRNPDLLATGAWPVLTMDHFFRRSGILEILNKGADYRSARIKVNPNENPDKPITGARISASLIDRLQRIAGEIEKIVSRCRLGIR